MARGRPRGASCSTAATDETVRLAPKPSQGALVPVTSTENRNLVVLQRSPATNSPGMFREPLAHPIVGPRPVEAVGVPPLVLRQGGQHVLDKLLPRRPLPPFLLPRQESFASLHILTRRASEGSEALPSLARRVRMSFFLAGVIEGAHAIDVGARKPADSGEGGLQVLAEAVDHCGAPAFGLLPFHDVLADVPVERKEFVVNGEGGLDLGVSDAFFQVAQEVGIAERHRQRPASAWLIGWCAALLCHRCTGPLPGRCLPTVPVLAGLGK